MGNVACGSLSSFLAYRRHVRFAGDPGNAGLGSLVKLPRQPEQLCAHGVALKLGNRNGARDTGTLLGAVAVIAVALEATGPALVLGIVPAWLITHSA